MILTGLNVYLVYGPPGPPMLSVYNSGLWVKDKEGKWARADNPFGQSWITAREGGESAAAIAATVSNVGTRDATIARVELYASAPEVKESERFRRLDCGDVKYYFQQPDGSSNETDFGSSIDFPRGKPVRFLIYFTDCGASLARTDELDDLHLAISVGADPDRRTYLDLKQRV